MPPAHASHASMPGISPHQPREDSDAARPAARPLTRKTDKQSFDYVWRSGIAGGLAGCAGKSVVAPLDRVKILFQSNNPHFAKYSGSWAGVAQSIRLIYGQDGPAGLFRGHSATLIRIFPYAAIKFLAYEQIRSVVIPDHDHETPLRRLISGSLAGVTSVFFTYPLEVVRVRLAFETKREGRSSLSDICRKIYHEHPVAPSPQSPGGGGGVARTVDAAIAALRSWAELLAGGVAGLVSQTVSYPLEIIRRRMQVGGAVGDGRRLRIAETAAIIMKEKGVRGFFVGLTIGYAKVAPMAAVAFYTYEKSKILLGI
ncbi:hypothetical protein MAPG_05217 [Magnaporthiopsis poae ATCC 64411]|uniref:Mitochondrial thiamine pyrophosphate carrier 1 n=1 Tax=Magnaporthiopsis poae (strain ATCC 64411 / 73-15) TaxID=644358 RepID=A0A0C4DYT8_MAGP6|nr:hypothetical protein MAPG_05217 [Magnaporthiopsis poae ATCC 64411]